MATVTHRLAHTDNSDGTSYTSPSVAFAVNELPVVFVQATGSAVQTGTLADSLGGTWTKVATASRSGSATTGYCFIRDSLAPGAMTLTFSCPDDAATGCTFLAAGVSGMTKTGSLASKQTPGVQSNQGGGGTPSPSFGNPVGTSNPTLGFVFNATNPAGLTPPTSWIERADVGHATPTGGAEYVSRDSGFTGTTITWGSTSATSFGAIIVELDASGGTSATLERAAETDLAQAITASAAPPISLPHKVARARYTLEVAWSAILKGTFVIGTSTIGGQDKIGISSFDTVFTGEHDDLSAFFRGGTIRRGRDDSRQLVNGGDARITVKDPTGMLNPENAASPLFDLLKDSYAPTRLRGYLPSGQMLPLYYGFLETVEWQASGRVPGAGIATLVCRDFLVSLREARPLIAATGATTTGAAIGKILDAVGWIDPTGRQLAVGDSIPDFSADGTKTALDLISELLIAERGVFYMSAAGVAVFDDRIARQVRTSSATITNEMSMVVPAIDHARRRNRVRVKRTQTGYIATAIDPGMRTLMGDRDLEDIETSYLLSDSQADALASYLLAQYTDPLTPMRDLKIDNRTLLLLTQCLQRELGHVVTIEAAGAAISSAEYLIESLQHRIDPRRGSHQTTWLLSKHAPITPFRIGMSQLVATAPGDVFVY